jgi:hypothetical protein
VTIAADSQYAGELADPQPQHSDAYPSTPSARSAQAAMSRLMAVAKAVGGCVVGLGELW